MTESTYTDADKVGRLFPALVEMEAEANATLFTPEKRDAFLTKLEDIEFATSETNPVLNINVNHAQDVKEFGLARTILLDKARETKLEEFKPLLTNPSVSELVAIVLSYLDITREHVWQPRAHAAMLEIVDKLRELGVVDYDDKLFNALWKESPSVTA